MTAEKARMDADKPEKPAHTSKSAISKISTTQLNHYS
jgi:hypothetical protein